MLVEIVPSTVVTPRRPRVSVPGGILHIPQAGSGVEGKGHEGMSEVVGVQETAVFAPHRQAACPQSKLTGTTRRLHRLARHRGCVADVTEPSGPIEKVVEAGAGGGSQPESTPPTAEVPVTTPSAPPGYAYGPPPGQGPPPGYGWAGSSSSPPPGGGFLRNVTVAWIVAGVLALAVVALSVALATGSSSPARFSSPFRPSAPNSGRPFAGPGFFGGNTGGLGAFGTVASVGTGSFTVTERAGQMVTVDEQSSTTYYNGSSTASSSAVVVGARVAVQGSVTGSTVTATRVDVLPAGGFGAGPSS